MSEIDEFLLARIDEFLLARIDEFLLARIGEDEAVAKAATQGAWEWSNDEFVGEPCKHGYEWMDHGPDLMAGDEQVLCANGYDASSLTVTRSDAAHIVRWQPPRVLAECAAKRSLVEDLHVWLVSDFEAHPMCLCCRTEWPCLTLRTLARVWSDHPDFDPAWAGS